MNGGWTCPDCARPFGRTNQRHLCAPGLTLDEFFADSHERERPIFEAVRAHLDELGPVDIDPVQIGILFKHGPVFVELRPMKKWVALTFFLPVKLEHDRLSRKVVRAGGNGSRYYHTVNLSDATEVDEVILDWLTEAYLAVD